jgi:radical SAM superfamily enzyme YgiQ (UPF0313 family)
MNILLVNPPRSPRNAILEHAPREAKGYVHRKLIGPPLGLLTVAAALRDFDVTLLEMKGEYDLDPGAGPPERLVLDYLEKAKPDIVGVTFIASEFDAGMSIFAAVKAWNASTLTVAGGIHATLCPGDFEGGLVDVVAPGPSAPTMRDIARAAEEKRPFDSIGGIFIGSSGRLAPTQAPAPARDPAGKDFIRPMRSHLKRWLSTYTVGDGRGLSTYVTTSLGCPNRCSFCSIWPQHGGAFLQRDVESIIEELGSLDEYPVVRFADANTVVDVDFAGRLFDRIEETGIRKDFIMDMRVDIAARHPGLIEKMARGGLRVVICGFESFRDDELARYNKGTQAAMIGEAIRVFHDNGILVRGNYVVPPWYDEVDFESLAEYAASHKVTYAGYTILTPMPGTAYHNEMKSRIVDHDLSKYNFFNCVLRTKLPLEKFHECVGRLWMIKKGTDVL